MKLLQRALYFHKGGAIGILESREGEVGLPAPAQTVQVDVLALRLTALCCGAGAESGLANFEWCEAVDTGG